MIDQVLVNSDVKQMTEVQKARLTTWLVDQRLRGDLIPRITKDLVAYVNSKPPLAVHERAERLLRYIAESTETLGDYMILSQDNCDAALAWSESVEWPEVYFLIGFLKDRGWVATGTFERNMFKGWATVDGYGHIAEQATNVDSSQAFVAMWIDPSMDEALEEGIRPAIEAAGYDAVRIDQKEHINKIDDEIIAEIRRSRFLVADFTQGPDGARGGVYYEAGFARGLGIPVFYTCREDLKHKLHFDTRQFNHILWNSYGRLHKALKDRIVSVVGEGPGIRGNLRLPSAKQS